MTGLDMRPMDGEPVQARGGAPTQPHPSTNPSLRAGVVVKAEDVDAEL
jgi:hypothetical protein